MSAPQSASGPLLALRRITTTITIDDLRSATAAKPYAAGVLPLDPAADLRIDGAAVADLTAADRQTLHDLGYQSEPVARDGGIDVAAATDAPTSLAALRQIYARLRRPDGCPWDREQTPESMLAPILSEVQELDEAVRAADWPHVAEELGDALGNLLMLAQIAEEAGLLSWPDVVAGISTKLVRRHPHVFAGEQAQSVDDIVAIWQRVKQEERAGAENTGASTSREDQE